MCEARIVVNEDVTASPPVQPASGKTRRRVIIGAAAVAVLVILYFVLSATLPRWWGETTGNMVGGNSALGAFVGLVFGLLFSLLPLIALRYIVKPGLSRSARALMAVLVVVLAIPNLLTLSVVWGGNNSAHDGLRAMNDHAPSFRGASLIGFLVAVAVFVLALALLASRKHTRQRVRKLSAKLAEVESAQTTDAEPAVAEPAPKPQPREKS